MSMSRLSVLLPAGIGAFVLSPMLSFVESGLIGPGATMGFMGGPAFAQTDKGAEKEAFEAAKELGTVEAWDAFLSNYPTGFHADLARAYVKKLAAPPAAAPPAAAPAPAVAAPAAPPPPDDFPVAAASWGGIVRSGPGKNYRKVDSLDEGQPVTLVARTDVVEDGFPWFKITYEDDGSGYQWGGILCSTGAERPDIFKTCAVREAKPKSKSKTTSKKSTKSKSSSSRCGSGRIRIDGKCIRKRDAASYCGPGYRPQGGRCVQGYKAPPANAPLSTQQQKGLKKGCPTGQVWNAQEGCHYDD